MRFAGHRVCTPDDTLVNALLHRGGRVQRRGRDYSFDLRRGVPAEWRDPSLPDGLRLAPVAVTDALVASYRAAVSPGHPDYDANEDVRRELAGLVAGQILGPFLDASRLVTDGTTEWGAVFVTLRDRPRDLAGAWVCELFVHPAWQRHGVARALLQHALARVHDAGHARLGLVVTAGNSAERLYQSMGFTKLATLTNVDLPTAP